LGGDVGLDHRNSPVQAGGRSKNDDQSQIEIERKKNALLKMSHETADGGPTNKAIYERPVVKRGCAESVLQGFPLSASVDLAHLRPVG
jgi:hypothetical protein